MNWNKFGLGKEGIFGVCDGLSNFTGIPVLAFRIFALFLLYKGLFTFYFYAWILLFVGGKSSGRNQKSVIDIKIGDSKGRPKSKTKKDNWEEFEKKFEKIFDDSEYETKKKKKSKKKSKKDMSFDRFKSNHYSD